MKQEPPLPSWPFPPRSILPAERLIEQFPGDVEEVAFGDDPDELVVAHHGQRADTMPVHAIFETPVGSGTNQAGRES